MAKKGKAYFLHFNFEVEIMVPSDQIPKFLSDVNREEFSLSADIKYGDGRSSNLNIYPDMLKSGEMTLVLVKDQRFQFSFKGVTAHKLDLPFQSELLASLEQSDLEVVPTGVVNSDAKSVDLDVKNVSLRGRCSLSA